MPVHHSIPSLTFTAAREALSCALDADMPVLMLGDPGVGKTALATLAAEGAKLPLETLLGSTCDPTDVGGIPFVHEGSLLRLPIAPVRAAAAAPTVLFLDEISCAPPSVQASLLRVLLERVAGDLKLHGGSRVIAAANPAEQAPGGFELSAPLMGRVCALHLRPAEEEVLAFLATLGAEGSELRLEAEDFVLTAGQEPNLMQVDIPKGAVSGNVPWGAPRSWERAIRLRAAAGMRAASWEVMHALTAGSVGEDCATAYAAVLKLRRDLPSVDAICTDPAGAHLPKDRKLHVAAVGLIPRVADRNSWAAYIYAERLVPEIGMACTKLLMARRDSPIDMPHSKEGVKARIKLTQAVARMGGV